MLHFMSKLTVDECAALAQTCTSHLHGAAEYIQLHTVRRQLRPQLRIPYRIVDQCGLFARDLAWNYLCQKYAITGIAAHFMDSKKSLHTFSFGEALSASEPDPPMESNACITHEQMIDLSKFYAINCLLYMLEHSGGELEIRRYFVQKSYSLEPPWQEVRLLDDLDAEGSQGHIQGRARVSKREYAAQFSAALETLRQQPELSRDRLHASQAALWKSPLGQAVTAAPQTCVEYYLHDDRSRLKQCLVQNIMFWWEETSMPSWKEFCSLTVLPYMD